MAKAKEAEKGELAGYEELRKVDPAVLASSACVGVKAWFACWWA
jgi:hypothetical protein